MDKVVEKSINANANGFLKLSDELLQKIPESFDISKIGKINLDEAMSIAEETFIFPHLDIPVDFNIKDDTIISNTFEEETKDINETIETNEENEKIEKIEVIIIDDQVMDISDLIFYFLDEKDLTAI